MNVSVSAVLFPLCHGTSEDVTEEMAAKELRNTQQIYQVWPLLINKFCIVWITTIYGKPKLTLLFLLLKK